MGSLKKDWVPLTTESGRYWLLLLIFVLVEKSETDVGLSIYQQERRNGEFFFFFSKGREGSGFDRIDSVIRKMDIVLNTN